STDIYTLSLHDALPISRLSSRGRELRRPRVLRLLLRTVHRILVRVRWRRACGRACSLRRRDDHGAAHPQPARGGRDGLALDPHRSEEHTSELQSLAYLV